MINTVVRLEFEHVFPNEKEQGVLFYLKKISSTTLLNVIGFSNTSPTPNFDNFASNPDVREDIIQRVIRFLKEKNIREKSWVSPKRLFNATPIFHISFLISFFKESL